MAVYRRNPDAGAGFATASAYPDHDMDKREVMLFGDIYRVNCPRCGEAEAFCMTPLANGVICFTCGKYVDKENVVSFLRSAMLDLEELS
ncbi:MAG: hypothetical protein ACPLQO_02280 [Desulfotomaculales bacterium]